MTEEVRTATPSLSTRIGRERLDALVDRLATDGDAKKQVEDVTADLAAHMGDLRDLGIIKPHDSLPNRRMNLQHSWNVMCGVAEHPYSSQDGETQEVAQRLAHGIITMPLHMLAFDVRSGKVDSETREEKMRSIMHEMDSGDLPWWKLGAHEHDFVTGEQLDFEMRGWALVFGKRGHRGAAITPIDDVAPVAMHEIEIDLPTGELLIADWFRPEGFTDMVDEGNPWRGGSQEENERDAERYLRDHGFVSVSSARRSLTVFQRGGTVTVGHHDEDGDHPKPAGFRRIRDVTIDLRKVTMADKATLTATMARIHPEDRARELVDEVARGRDTVKVTVKPGRYRVRSSGRGYIEDLLATTDPLKVPGYEPVLIMERVG